MRGLHEQRALAVEDPDDARTVHPSQRRASTREVALLIERRHGRRPL